MHVCVYPHPNDECAEDIVEQTSNGSDDDGHPGVDNHGTEMWYVCMHVCIYVHGTEMCMYACMHVCASVYVQQLR